MGRLGQEMGEVGQEMGEVGQEMGTANTLYSLRRSLHLTLFQQCLNTTLASFRKVI